MMREARWFASSRLAARESIAAIVPRVGGETGIIRDVSVQSSDPDEPCIFHAESRLNEPAHHARLFDDGVGITTGAGLTPELALACALGEGLERYCYAVHDPTEVVVSCYDQLARRSPNAIAPSAFALYSHTQFAQRGFPYRPFTNDLPVSWVRGCSLTTGDEAWVPDLFVHAPYGTSSPGDLTVGPSTTTGLCCAPSLEEAVLGGICEVVERDAAMCMWANRLPCAPLRPPDGSWLAEVLADRFSGSDFHLSLYDLTSDNDIPTVLAVLVDELDSDAAVAVGSATRPIFEAAALKAAFEAAQVRRWLKRSRRHRTMKRYRSDFGDVRDFEDHVALFGAQESRRHFEFLVDRSAAERWTPEEDAGTAKDQLRGVLRNLGKRHLDVIVVDITRPEVAALGFHVVKVVVPGMIDINADHNHRQLGRSRLFAVPRLLGYRCDDSSEAELNIVPHPFP